MKKKAKKTKSKKSFDLIWAFENFEDHHSFYSKRMFGGLSAYVHDRMMMCLTEDPGNKEWRGKKYPIDLWNGILLPTNYEHHSSIIEEFPEVIQHPMLEKWLYLPLTAKNFESMAHHIATKMYENDIRFGVYPQKKISKKRKKKVAKKKETTKKRCKWCGTDPLYVEYHDKEWGVPVYDDTTLFEFLILESAQAGLSWITVLKKRENYRKAFAQFDPKKVAKFNERKIQSLLKDEGIIRNQLKIRATVNNAKMFLEVQKEFGTFAKYVWGFVGGKPKKNKWKTLKAVPAKTKESDALSKDLKKRGFKFVGSTIIYAYMQACGLVNDHTTDCFLYDKINNIKPRKRF